ncbi:DgyrCDS3200 [Dimorphilus gyrociliatus]|uniref:DgyrCDS3200 n=1 Tax=Dimorphilus gyrociliatus TaxID=2664684 RepID=A0A7I8VDM6_9ANNE|nr:DgyrCDS3200 [Dimorphilus gyrociliatus]
MNNILDKSLTEHSKKHSSNSFVKRINTMRLSPVLIIFGTLFVLINTKSAIISIDGKTVKYSGDSLNVVIEYVNKDLFCRIDSAYLDPCFTLVGASSAIITPLTGSAIFTLDILLDENVINHENKTIKVTCNFNEGIFEETLSVMIAKRNPKYDVGPFFMQTVYDFSHGVYSDICYYLSSFCKKRHLKLYQDRQKKFSIQALLSKQGKISNVFINSTFMNIKISPRAIIVDKYYSIDWNDCLEVFQLNSPKISLFCYDNTLKIKLIDPNSTGGYPQITFRKLKLDKLNYYIEIYSIAVNDYQNVEGLFGQVGKSQFEFFKRQGRRMVNNSESTDKTTTLRVNKKLTTAKEIKQDNQFCWLLNIQDLVNLQNF